MITLPDGWSQTTTAGGDGTWSISLFETLKAGGIVSAVAMDTEGNITKTTSVVVIDATPPNAPIINAVDDNNTEIRGSAEVGTTVTVTLSHKTIETTTPGVDGTWSIPLTEPLAAGTAVSATATDAAGNISDSSSVIVTDETAPNAPIINTVNNTDVVISGTAEPGSTVTITFPDGWMTSTAASANSVWSFALEDPLSAGSVISVIATDAAGNISATASTIVTDVIAPGAPTINNVDDDDMIISGTAEAGSTVTVTFANGTTKSAISDPENKWTIQLTEPLTAGSTISVTATDAAGNVSAASSKTVIDVTAPTAPIINTIGDSDTIISGTAEAESTIAVTLPDGTIMTTQTSPDGTWTILLAESLAAYDRVYATATDAVGNVSVKSYTIVTDTTAPEAPTFNPIDDKDMEINGIAEVNSTVTVTFPNGKTRRATADEDGVWSIPLIEPLAMGEKVRATATDAAGNISETESVIVIDGTAPNEITINTIDDNDTVINGTAEEHSTVTVTLSNGSFKTAIAGIDGSWSISLSEPLPAGETVSATATDNAGNTSATFSTIVVDRTAPKAAKINTIDDNDTVITGTAEPGSTVTVTLPDGSMLSTKAGADGKWSIQLVKPISAGEKVSVKVVDETGNISPLTSIVVQIAPKAPSVVPGPKEPTAIKDDKSANKQESNTKNAVELTNPATGQTVEYLTPSDTIEPNRSQEPANSTVPTVMIDGEAVELISANVPRVLESKTQSGRMFLQAALNMLGYSDMEVDGLSVIETRNAIEAFKTAHGLRSNGRFTIKTRNAMVERLDNPPNPDTEVVINGEIVPLDSQNVPPVDEGLRGEKDAVIFLQASLNKLTGSDLVLNGKKNGESEEVMKAFQELSELEADGTYDEHTKAAFAFALENESTQELYSIY